MRRRRGFSSGVLPWGEVSMGAVVGASAASLFSQASSPCSPTMPAPGVSRSFLRRSSSSPVRGACVVREPGARVGTPSARPLRPLCRRPTTRQDSLPPPHALPRPIRTLHVPMRVVRSPTPHAHRAPDVLPVPQARPRMPRPAAPDPASPADQVMLRVRAGLHSTISRAARSLLGWSSTSLVVISTA